MVTIIKVVQEVGVGCSFMVRRDDRRAVGESIET
jgi:hypothetical protein